ncbi:MAG: hypothetical protein F6K39_34670 [Okeania sp. SIO3B3]|nr:hypothetical protein [Okeania sp. SIO3B3]
MNKPEFVAHVAQKITDLNLTMPTLLLLEAHKPLAFIGSQLLLIAQPTLDLFMKPGLVENMADLLASPADLESLLQHLEAVEKGAKQ